VKAGIDPGENREACSEGLKKGTLFYRGMRLPAAGGEMPVIQHQQPDKALVQFKK